MELNQNSLAVEKRSSKDREGHGFRGHGKALDSYQLCLQANRKLLKLEFGFSRWGSMFVR